MPIKPGTYVSRIKDIGGIKDRCKLSDDWPGCWIWAGACSKGRPNANVVIDGRRTSHGVVKLAWYYAHGETHPPAGLKPCRKMTCHALCVNPAHQSLVTHGECVALALATPSVKRQESQRRNAAHMAAFFRKLTDAQIADILESTESQRSLAKKHGVSLSTVSDIKRGRRHHQTVPGSSVFTWRP